MLQKIQMLYGIEKLNDQTRKILTDSFDRMVTEKGDPDESKLMRVFIYNLGAHQLDEQTQKSLREKTCDIILALRKDDKIKVKDYKWDNYSASPQLNEIKKENYRWKNTNSMAGEMLLGESISDDKVKKSNYHWGTKNTTI